MSILEIIAGVVLAVLVVPLLLVGWGVVLFAGMADASVQWFKSLIGYPDEHSFRFW